MKYTFDSLKDEYRSQWDSMVVLQENPALVQCKQILTGKSRYASISAFTGVPWFVIAILHAREAGSPPDWKACLHNGERIIGTGRKTNLVPRGRGPFRTFEDAAIDALEMDGLEEVDWQDGWGPEHVAFALELFNGFGYRQYHQIPSPYLWGGSTIQKPGKYTRDGHYDSHVIDAQIGGMTLLWELMRLDPSVTFTVPLPPLVAAVLPPAPSPAIPNPAPPSDILSDMLKAGEQNFHAILTGIGGMFQRGKTS